MCPFALEYVPSLQRAVAPSGAFAGRATDAVEGAGEGAGGGVVFDVVSGGLVGPAGGAGTGLAAGALLANQVRRGMSTHHARSSRACTSRRCTVPSHLLAQLRSSWHPVQFLRLCQPAAQTLAAVRLLALHRTRVWRLARMRHTMF